MVITVLASRNGHTYHLSVKSPPFLPYHTHHFFLADESFISETPSMVKPSISIQSLKDALHLSFLQLLSIFTWNC
ncbi:hypothetical protein IMY05_014G0075900 [Salix suchowensis]|nr:hypothetical protein IMY05_014G0075900 [Salix suchowensis]